MRHCAAGRAGSIGKPEKYQERAVEPNKIGIGELAEVIAHIHPWHRRDLVDHDLTWLLDPGGLGRLHGYPDKWRLDWIGRQRAHHNRSG